MRSPRPLRVPTVRMGPAVERGSGGFRQSKYSLPMPGAWPGPLLISLGPKGTQEPGVPMPQAEQSLSSE